MTSRIRVVIADDSIVVRQLLRYLLESDGRFTVIAEANDGLEAVEIVQKLKPDIITMDIQMPKMDGLQAIEFLMRESPIPIIVISSYTNDATMNITFEALQAGALSVMNKPQNIRSPYFTAETTRLLDTIANLSEVHVIRRRSLSRIQEKSSVIVKPIAPTTVQLLALGCSTGGPAVLQKILSALPSYTDIPIVIVQHITDGFLPGMIAWLQQSCQQTISALTDGETLKANRVYFAPNRRHLVLSQSSEQPFANLVQKPDNTYFKPSVNVLFDSIAKHFGRQAIAGLLTGMGDDGADGLLDIKKAGGLTFIQDESSSVVFGMPGAAKNINAHCHMLNLEEIIQFVKYVTSRRNK